MRKFLLLLAFLTTTLTYSQSYDLTDIYGRWMNFDGTQTTRSFIPTLIIGSKIDTADIQLEDGTYTGEDQVFSSFEGRLQLETEEGIITTERFLCTDAICVFKWSLLAKLASQIMHLCDFCFSCTEAICISNCYFVQNWSHK